MLIITDFNSAGTNGTGTDFLHAIDKNYEALQKQDAMAKEAGRLVGRYIREQYADGYAYYVITRENKKTVRIKAATGLGDDWVIPYWGEEANIEKSYALNNLEWLDRMDEAFKKNKEKTGS